MVKNRKPMFVSEQALARLKELAQEQKCFTGDVVDILLGVKTREQLDEEYKNNEFHSRRAGRSPTKAQLARRDGVVVGSTTDNGGSY